MAVPPSHAAAEGASSAPNTLTSKPIHSLILDTGPLIKNDPPVSVLLAKAEKLYTLPVIISEIRDAATRSRVETTLLPFITLRSPKPESVKFVADFSKKTGDYSVLSKPDLEVLALGYEVECERNGGDWRLRNTPGQQGLNGGRPPKEEEEKQDAEAATQSNPQVEIGDQMQKLKLGNSANEDAQDHQEPTGTTATPGDEEDEDVATDQSANVPENDDSNENDEDDEDDDNEGWITPSNLKKHQTKDAGSAGTNSAPQQIMQAAILTSDYAMQNVALRINLNLVTPSLARITHLKNWVLRCHGCFTICKEMSKQFCPKCGQPTLTRVSCSTDEHGNFKVHLKQNFQWNNRGNVFSVPKPVHGTSNGRLPSHMGGGKNGWGRDLILAEDQKEYIKQQDEQRRQRKKDLMDEDFLPGLLGGQRQGGSGKIRVGAGRNINSKRKR